MTTVITTTTRTQENIEDCGFRDRLQITSNTDGLESIQLLNVMDDEPEDSNLGRSFGDCYSIAGLMQSAYEAGKNGEEWTFKKDTCGLF